MPTVFRKEELETDEALSWAWALGLAALFLSAVAVIIFSVGLAYGRWPSFMELLQGFSMIVKSLWSL